jgi:hypothetical protein
MRVLTRRAIAFATFGLASLSALPLASSANGYPGGCYTDALGNCVYAPPELFAPEDSPADDAAWGSTPDQNFAYFVTHDDDHVGFVIADFATTKAHGLRACQQLSNGMSRYNVMKDMSRIGGYTLEEADNILVAAVVVYCNWALP